jgi:hypothetical protein
MGNIKGACEKLAAALHREGWNHVVEGYVGGTEEGPSDEPFKNQRPLLFEELPGSLSRSPSLSSPPSHLNLLALGFCRKRTVELEKNPVLRPHCLSEGMGEEGRQRH